eukprot:6799176-Pyramimonas_sp.AAC.1
MPRPLAADNRDNFTAVFRAGSQLFDPGAPFLHRKATRAPRVSLAPGRKRFMAPSRDPATQ